MTGEVRQGPRIHVWRPPCQTGMPESVKRKVFQAGRPAHLSMLPLQARWFDMAAGSGGRKDPGTLNVRAAHLQNRRHVLGERDSPARVVRFPVRQLKHAVLYVLPTQPEALFK